jgi:hypothetical protein
VRPDSAGYQAGPDGKDVGADIDLVGPGAPYERWKQTPEYRQWLEDSGQLRAESPKAEPGAFVLLGGKGVAELKFDTLAEAVQRASAGDTIEVRGNGPFVIEPVTVTVPLVIRAGSGNRPVLALRNSAPHCLATVAPLVLEGLELICGDTDPKGGAAPAALVRVTNSPPLFVSHCRLIMTGNGRALYGNPRHCEIRECEVIRKSGVSNQAVGGWEGGPGHRLSVEGCAIAGNFLGVTLPHDDRVLEPCSVRLARNTFIGGSRGPAWPVALWRWDDSGPGKAPLRLEVTDNIITGGRFLFLADRDGVAKLDPAAAREFVKQFLSYQEHRNLFEADTQLLTYFRETGDGGPLVSDAGTWQQLFGLENAPALSRDVRFEGGSLPQRVNLAPQSVTAADFRLRADSPGYRAGKDGKDLGADVDLVGPGAAYERWKKTPEYQEWLKETGQVSSQ